MSLSVAVILALSITCFCLFYLSNSISIPVNIKNFSYYFNVILKIFFQQMAILLIPTIISMCNYFLMDFGTMPTVLKAVDRMTGTVWWIYYIYATVYAFTLIFFGISSMLSSTGDKEL